MKRLAEILTSGYEQNEEWRPIPDFDMYEVSNLGRIRNKKTGRIVRPHVHYGRSKTVPYLRVSLSRKGKKHNVRVSRAVAMAFIPNPNRLKEVDHVNDDSMDNRVENLEWVSPQENVRRRAERYRKQSDDETPYYDKMHDQYY